MIFDAHCDTLSTGRGLFRNDGHFDVERALKAGCTGQIFAAFGKDRPGQLTRLKAMPEVSGFTAVAAVEGGDDVRSAEDVRRYFSLGVRLLGLTWNNDNLLAGGCAGEGGGLTKLGRETVELCAELGIIIDLSHASRQTFDDVLDMAAGPVCVTHACCDGLSHHRRNLTDSQLRRVAEAGGVTGITYYPPFLTGSERADISDIAAHIAHAVSVAGAGHVGLGSDFDGCEVLPSGVSGVQSVPNIIGALPFSGGIKEMIAGKNWRGMLNID